MFKVNHPKLYLRVNGKLQHVKLGDPVPDGVTTEAAKKLGKKVAQAVEKKQSKSDNIKK